MYAASALKMVVKRFFDLLLALATAIFLAIPVLLVALAVRLTSAGPVLWLTFVKVLPRDGVSH